MNAAQPSIVERAEQPYVALLRQVDMPFDGVIAEVMPLLERTIKAQGIQGTGAAIFKYNIVKMPELEIEFGFETTKLEATSGDLIAGTLPAGRYAQITYFGPYDDLYEVNKILIDWSREEGLVFDMHPEVDGDHFASRVEIYPNSPEEEPDPNKLKTVVAIRLKD